MITFHRLEIFAAIAKHLNVTKAARELHISQSSVSHQLKLLESDVARELTRIRGRNIELTAAGQSFLTEIELIRVLVESLVSKYLGRPSRRTTENLIIGGSHGPSISPLPSLMASFHKGHPMVRLFLRTGTSEEIERMILKQSVDIALVSNPSRSLLTVGEPYCREKMIFVVSKSHALRGAITPSELEKVPLLIAIGKRGERRLEQTLRGALKGVKINITMRFDSLGALIAAVKTGVGIGLIHEDIVKDELRAGSLKVLTAIGVSLNGQSHIVYLKNRTLPAVAREFLDFMRAARDDRLGGEASHVGPAMTQSPLQKRAISLVKGSGAILPVLTSMLVG